MTGKTVKTEGCSSCSCAKECLSEALLQGSFIRDDGVIFTATMTATGVGETACDAQEQSYKNIIKTLEDFITNYTPKIVEVTYELTYSITCDGKSTCCQPKICKKSFLTFTLYTKNVVTTVITPDLAIGGYSVNVALKHTVGAQTWTREKLAKNIPGLQFMEVGDALANGTVIRDDNTPEPEVDAAATATTTFRFPSQGSPDVVGLRSARQQRPLIQAQFVDSNTGNSYPAGVDLSDTRWMTNGTTQWKADQLKASNLTATGSVSGNPLVYVQQSSLGGAMTYQFLPLSLTKVDFISAPYDQTPAGWDEELKFRAEFDLEDYWTLARAFQGSY